MVFDKQIITQSPQETQKLGQELADNLIKVRKGSGPTVVCLYGDLGCGKTTFAQGFASGLGIENRLLSPTFIIVRRYQIPKMNTFLYHLDLYRLATNEELEGLGIREIFSESGSIILVEWAEKLGSLIPNTRIDVSLSVSEDGAHQARINQYE